MSPVARWLRDSSEGPRKPESKAERLPESKETRESGIESPANPKLLQGILASSPSRLGVGRAGTRYRTSTYLELRADHAIAIDAVSSEVKPELPARLGCISLVSQAKDRNDFLLYPNHGRRLAEESRARLSTEGTRGADIQLILGDGLSAWALEANGEATLKALQAGMAAAGWSVGKPLFVKFARVGVQDEIGVLLGARATVILVGERPGLGTGDSLSLYSAFAPKLDQDNAEKNCISNVRSLGIAPAAAAIECVATLKRAFAQGRGGVALT